MYHIFHGKHRLILANSKKKTDKHNPDFILKEPGHAQVLEALKLSKNATKPLTIVLLGDPEIILSDFLLEFKLIIAGGGLVLNESEKLLSIKRLGKWDLPKGKIKKKEEVEIGALREVIEETGIKGLTITQSFCDTFHTYFVNEKWLIKQTHWYIMRAPKNQLFIPQLDEDITEVQWIEIQDLVDTEKLDTYPTIRFLAKKLKKHLRSIG